MSERSSRTWTALFYAVTIASAVPFFVTRYLPLCDLPEHVAAIATLERVISGESTPYVVAFGSSQYLLYHGAGALLAFVVRDAVLANQILLALVAVAWPLSFRSLLRASGRDERLALFAPMVFWNRALLIGFLPFVASIPLALFAAATVIRQAKAYTARRAILLAILALALFYLHVSSYILLVVIALAWTLVARLRLSLVAVADCWKVLAPLVPSVIAAGAWWSAGSLARDPASPNDADVGTMTLSRTIKALPVWTFDVWRSHIDEACAVLWWSALAVLLLFTLKGKGKDESVRARLLPWIPLACAAIAFLVMPFRVGAAAMLNVRLAPVVVLLFVLPLSIASRRRLAQAPLAIAAFVSLVASGNAAYEMRATSQEILGDRFDDLLASMRPNTRVATLAAQTRSEHAAFWPYVYMGSYHVARGGSVASYSFVQMPHWPVHYATSAQPPRHAPFWIFRPCEYRYEDDGAYYDYVIVEGAMNPFDDGVAGPPFVAVAKSGRLTLYEKVSGPSRGDPSAIGPCRRPAPLAQR